MRLAVNVDVEQIHPQSGSQVWTAPTGTADPASAECCDDFNPSRPDGQAALREKLEDVAGVSEIFKALGDETRTRIIYLLSLQEMCVCDIAAVLDMTLPAVSHHLRLLKLMRLVKHRREGKNVFYSLDDHHIVGLIQLAKAHYHEGR